MQEVTPFTSAAHGHRMSRASNSLSPWSRRGAPDAWVMGWDDRLTGREREEIARALRVGRDLSAPIKVTHFFSAHGREPVEAAALLWGLRVVVDEESGGDAYCTLRPLGSMQGQSAGKMCAELDETELA
jgi:hypothetical protein